MSTFLLGQTEAYNGPNDGVIDYSVYSNGQSRATEDFYRQHYDSTYVSTANGEPSAARYWYDIIIIG